MEHPIMYWSKMICLVIFGVTFMSQSLADSDVSCYPECAEGFYCIENQCQNCFDCNYLHREAASTCAKIPSDCGDCKTGYVEISLTQNTRQIKKACKKRIQIGEKCTNDEECPQNSFCYLRDTCTGCFDCSIYFRLPGSPGRCAKAIEDCGSCISGYNEVALTEGSRPKSCQSRPAFSQSTKVNVNISAIPFLGTIGAIFIIVLGVTLILRLRKTKSHQLQGEVERGPPPYCTETDSRVYSESEISNREVGGFYKERSEEDCMARIYRLPEYARQGVNQQAGSSNPSEHIDALHDEETVPCTWEPYSDEAHNNSGSGPNQSVGTRPRSPADDDDSNEPQPKRVK